MAKPVEVSVQSSDMLRKLYEVFDELGMVRQFSEEHAELEIKIDATWVLFYVDRRALDDERALDQAFEDAQQVAESYWRQ